MIYQLQLSDYTVIEQPSLECCETQLRSLSPGPKGWVTLSRSFVDFLVVTGSVQEGFELEYECTTRDNHQRVAGQRLRVNDVMSAFAAYLNGDYSFYDLYQWERVSLAEMDMLKAPQIYWGSILNDPERKLYGR